MGFTLIDRTEFRLLQRILNEGRDAVRPVLAQRRDLGFNCARVLSQCDLMFTLRPGSYAPSVYDAAVLGMIELLAEYGSYINLVVYADERNISSGPSHWQRLGALMQSIPGCGILSAVNEESEQVNRVPFIGQLQKIPDVICSRGSNGGSYNKGPEPFMDVGEVHVNTQSEWWRKSKNPMEDIAWVSGIPAWVSEHDRPDQDRVIGHHADLAGIGALMCGAITFHAQEGKYSDPYGPSLPYAQAFTDRIKAIPPHFITGAPTVGMSAAGQYQRIDDPAYLRVYEKVLPDGRRWRETARLP